MATQYNESEVKTPVGADYRDSLRMDVATLGSKEAGKEAVDAQGRPLKKFLWWRMTKKQRLFTILGLVLLLLVVLVLIAWFVIVKAVFQHYANSVNISLNYLDVKSISGDSTLGVELSLRAQHDISLHATTEATTASLLFDGDEFGTFAFPALDIAKGEQDYNLTIDSDLLITDQDVFNSMAHGLVDSAQITLKASAELKAHGAGISYGGLNFERELTVDGFNNFASPVPTIDYMNWWGCTDDVFTIDINVTLDNVAQMGLNGIGALNLSLYYEQDYLGYATSVYPELGLPRGEQVQVFRAIIPQDSTALTSMVMGVIGKSAQFYISGDNAYATEYAEFLPALSYVNMSILYTDALANVALNLSCDILSLLG